MIKMKEKRLKILAISGSTKKNSTNGIFLRFIAESFQDTLDVQIYEKIDTLPHFNSDLDHENPPASIVEFRKLIQAADGVLFCTPEYVFSLPGTLKNAIEWNVSTTLFSNKAVALIVAATSGEKAMEALDLIMTTIEARIVKEAKLLIKGARGKIGKGGKIQDQNTCDRIEALMQAFIQSIKEENPSPTKYLK